MKYRPVDVLRKFVLRKCIEHLVVTSEHAVWFNLTFWENVTEKPYANKCWDKFSKALRKQHPGFRFVGVWARQARGAWHIHGVCNTRFDIEWLRRKAMRCGFGTQMFVKELDSDPKTPEKISRYITGYVTDKNCLDSERDKGVRRTIFVGKNVKVIDMRYKSGLKRVVSRGREILQDADSTLTKFEREFSPPEHRKKVFETWGDWYRRCRAHWFDLGWASLTDEEREEILQLDYYTQRYLDTGQWSYV
ncbi:MAG TPA: hypothetical protein VHG71_06615 [Verrucomicrobiae bacterium]|nr:hypothetical protein [Verrucomicrobiae bacterium]